MNQDWYDAQHSNIVSRGNLPITADFPAAADYFHKFIRQFVAKSSRRVLLIIDDFQDLVPNPFRQTTWNLDYVGFAATLKSVHLENPTKFVYLLASTNPNFIRQEFRDVQNPFLTSIDHRYVDLFSRDQVREMLLSLGTPMGVTLTNDAVDQIYKLFGGHPFLSRRFCSMLCESNDQRPIEFSLEDVTAFYEREQGQLDHDFHTILENLRVIFPSEYRLVLRMGHETESRLILTSAPRMFRDNLIGYGIVDIDGAFRMSAMLTYIRRMFDANAFLTISQLFDDVEEGMRYLISFTYKISYREAAESLLKETIDAIVGDTIAEPVTDNGAFSQLRGCRLPVLTRAILDKWDLFEATLGSREAVEEARRLYSVLHDDRESAAALLDDAEMAGAQQTLGDLRRRVKL